MSQHRYSYGEITVFAGWDRPLGYLFMVIENDTSEVPIYCDEDDLNNYSQQDTNHYQEILKTLSIPVPCGFWNAIENDRLEDKGNSFTQWELS